MRRQTRTHGHNGFDENGIEVQVKYTVQPSADTKETVYTLDNASDIASLALTGSIAALRRNVETASQKAEPQAAASPAPEETSRSVSMPSVLRGSWIDAADDCATSEQGAFEINDQAIAYDEVSFEPSSIEVTREGSVQNFAMSGKTTEIISEQSENTPTQIWSLDESTGILSQGRDRYKKCPVR